MRCCGRSLRRAVIVLLADARRAAPGQESGSQEIAATTLLQSVPRSPDTIGDLDALAEALRGYLVLQVVVDDSGHRRTHLYRSAGAAQRAIERAQARGRSAHLTLCHLVPVSVVGGEA